MNRNLQIYSIQEFDEGVRNGTFIDAKGKAYIIIGDTMNTSYSVHIDRRIISSAGQIVSFDGLLKAHGEKDIHVAYEIVERTLPTLADFIAYKQERNKHK